MTHPAAGRRATDLDLKTLIAIAGLLGSIVTGSIVYGRTASASESKLAGKLDATRFVTDSVRREEKAAADHEILLRLDRRVGAIYCGGVPAEKQAGCR